MNLSKGFFHSAFRVAVDNSTATFFFLLKGIRNGLVCQMLWFFFCGAVDR